MASLASGSSIPFDLIVLTAANPSQASGYCAQLEERSRYGLLPATTRWRVISDPGGKRVGSGLSTIAVLHEVASLFPGSTYAECFAGKRILIAHSGGDARRIPAYAAQGKIFMPLPCDLPSRRSDMASRPATLFDLLVETLSRLPRAAEGEVVLCSGDVLLTFDAGSTPLHVPGGVGGLGFAAPPAVGTHHGVYLPSNSVVGGPVVDYLQKPSEPEMAAHGAADSTGRILVDTGVISLAPRAAVALLDAAGVSRHNPDPEEHGLYGDVMKGRVALVDLYREIALALPLDMTKERYLSEISKENKTPTGLAALEKFYDRLREYQVPFHVAAVPDGEFFHVGVTKDLLWKFAEPSRAARLAGFENGHRVFDPRRSETDYQPPSHLPGGLTIYNAAGDPHSIHSTGVAYIEGTDFGAITLRLDGENVITSWLGDRDLHLPKGIGLTVLPVKTPEGSAEVPYLFGSNDDNKTLFANNGTWLNRTQQAWAELGLDLTSLLPEGEQSAWTLPVWRAGEAGWAVVAALLQTILTKDPLVAGQLDSSPGAYSLGQMMGSVDHGELLRRSSDLAGRFDAHHVLEDLLADPDFPILSRLSSLPDEDPWRDRFSARLERHLAHPEVLPLERARLLRAASVIEEKAHGASDRTEELNHVALSWVANAMESGMKLPRQPRPAAILHDQAVWVTAPARIDFAGGWSDTPPICLERGGAVLNAAVTLNGQYPIQAVAKLNSDGVIRLTSIDLGQQEIYRLAEEVNGPPSLGHWSSLAKAALVLTGIVPEHGRRGTLRDWLDVLGGGLDLTLFSGLPKGSGMGTSSILGAATLACLNRVLGHEQTHSELIAQTSLLEQRLTSGGGWQDQVGGVVAGVKLIRTTPGMQQTPSLQWTIFGPTGAASEGMQRRMLLYFTGQKRVAANILQHVIGRYLAREPEVLQCIDRLKHGAEEAKAALEANDIASFAGCVANYWELKKSLDPGSTNAHVEDIMGRVKKYTSASLLCGAGGGGFMLLLARDADAADRIRVTLNDNPPHEHARFFDFAIDGHGLKVTVL